MSKEPLLVQLQATVLADGTATVETGPVQYGESWYVQTIASTVDLASGAAMVLEPEVRVFIDRRFIAGSFAASLDSAGPSQAMNTGQRLRAVWSGADVGAIAQLTVSGTIERRARRG
jgi:hypothetical protein